MARSLTERLLDTHAVESAAHGGLALRLDHALVAGDAALLVLSAFAAIGVGVARGTVAVVCADSRTALEALGGARLQHAAARAGARFAPPALGRAARVYLERFAAPDRVVLGCSARLAGAGGIGTLALDADALELAAAWAGAPHELDRPQVVRIALEGGLPEGVGAVDLMLVLAGSPRAAALRGCVIEFGGLGVTGVAVEDRIAAASLAPELGALAVLWPSDESTRAWMRAQGRESDWKPLEAEPGAAFDRAVDLSGLIPTAGILGATTTAGAVATAGMLPVSAVVMGPGTPPDALVMLARALEGRSTPPATGLVVIPASRTLAEASARESGLVALAAAGAQVVDSGEGVPLAPPGADGTVGVFFGLGVRDLPGLPGQWRIASPATCIASALAGRLEDARGAPWLSERDAPMAAAGAVVVELLTPTAESDEPDEVRPLTLPPAPGDSARGPVLLCVGDDVGVDRILSWGPRLRPLLADLEALAEHAFEDIDAGFAARARAAGAGFVLAGERCGTGRVRDSEVLVLAVLGVRAVLARSFAPAFASSLAASGVLPLVWEEAGEGPTRGDELEIPALAEGLAVGRPLTVRNLSRGQGYTARLELAPRDAALACAGGRLRALRAAR